MLVDVRPATRRTVLRGATGLGLATVFGMPGGKAADPGPAMLMRSIPSTGELIPAVGLGTGINFGKDNQPGTAAQREAIAHVVETLVAGGGSVIDTASGYGPAERVIGEILSKARLRPRVFLATKLKSDELPGAELWQGSLRATAKGIVRSYAPSLIDADIRGSLQRLRTDSIDLMQVHEVANPKQSLAALREWKADKLIRYTGITTSENLDFPAVETVMRREKPDFVQLNYSLFDRNAEKRLLPAAAELGVAVLINLPLGGGSRFQRVRDKPLPEWASDFAASSWAQFFLKFVLANPVVTAVIPGTTQPKHMADNLGAGGGPLPDKAMRQRMIELIGSLGS